MKTHPASARNERSGKPAVFYRQPWPFPQFADGRFFADYACGTITPDPKEIEEADWFQLDALPILPEPISISRRLIEAALLER